MSTEERLLFLEQVVSILISERNGREIDEIDEEMLDRHFEETYFDI